MKRFLSLLFCGVLILTLQPSCALAVENYVTSDEGVAMIEELEDYRDMPYLDNDGKWYIGYGTLCQPELYPEGITPEEADVLMRTALTEMEGWVNQLLHAYDIRVTQYQFDALVSMTYNLGQQWMDPSYRLCSYLISGIDAYSEEEVVNAIGTWCHQGNQVLTALVNRRLREAFLFLYGEYANDGAEQYTYVHYDAAGGKVPNSTVFYPVGYPYHDVPVPEWENRIFLDWYTDTDEVFDRTAVAVTPQTVTARWIGDGSSAGNVVDYSQWINPFSDVTDDLWYFRYVRELNYKEVLGGYPDGTFMGGREVSTGEALKLILRAVGYPEQPAVEDIQGGHWASGYLALAEKLGCLSYGETANLDDPMSRLTVAKVAAVAMGLGAQLGVSPFADADDGYLLTMYHEQILEGTVEEHSRYFYPEKALNRAEICAIVSRVSGWKYVIPENPKETGYITYGNKTYPVKNEVAVCPYNTDLLVRNGSIMYYNDPAYTTALGIDVSSHQKEIDWQQVAASGIEFAMIRLGYRGYGMEGTVNLDPYFQQNLEGAKAAGLKVGVYFFSQAITLAEAEQEANFVLENLAGASLDYPVVYDWEEVGPQGRAYTLDNDTLTQCALTFCGLVEASGYKPMVYYNLPVGCTRYQLEYLTQYPVWFAQYSNRPTMYYDYRIWQYTDSGSVPGVSGKVDMNLAFIPY